MNSESDHLDPSLPAAELPEIEAELDHGEGSADPNDPGPTADPQAPPLRPEVVEAPGSPPDDVPRCIGKYRIERLLGKGGFGRVYLGHDDELKRPVAIKVPHRRRIAKPADVDAYIAEARVVASLDHPGIVPVYHVDRTPDGSCYVVSKFIEGSDLRRVIKHARPSHTESAKLVAGVAEALHYAHVRGVVHRDIKPANILLDNAGRPHVVDFGLAITEDDMGGGSPWAGTPAYMSPEQVRGEGHRVDGRADVFALGVVLYELLTGHRPFAGETESEVFEQIKSIEPRPLRQRDPSIPKELERICLKALSKRVLDRYLTAQDLADDLRCFLDEASDRPEAPDSQRPPAAEPITPTPTPASVGAGLTASPSPLSGSSSDRPIRIVPKGLRSFDAHDADFFLELLPGPRDRDGLPESIRFWKTRIEETDPDKTFAVGLIYGPSGCGKSSLVKAGLLPRLSGAVVPVFVEATAEETEARLLRGLRRQCPDLPEGLGLKESLTAIRRGIGIGRGKKVFIVLDQFEQWLHARGSEEHTELVEALRQCDGERVQCVVLIRDDFWMAATRFMQHLEIRLLEGRNSAAVDLFDIDHARRVLAAFGRAFGKLPENSGEISKDQRAFLEQAVAALAQEGKVVCVRLVLFAEMMKGRQWIPATLKEVGGAEGLGAAFLEETFAARIAPPEHRRHQKAARNVLKALLPEQGSDIKGAMRSREELLAVAECRPADFDQLLMILDGELRLITPTDPEGIDSQAEGGSASRRRYQLTHDYLVPSLRQWLTRKQRETRRGRAELRLLERSATWSAKPENRRLPAWWEYLNIRLFTRKRDWTEPQGRMMRSAARHHGLCWGTGLVLAIVLGLTLQHYASKHREELEAQRRENDERRAETLVDAVLTAPPDAVPYAIQNLEPLREYAMPILERRFGDSELPPSQRLHAALAMAQCGQIKLDFLVASIATAHPGECPNLITAMRPEKEAAIQAILQRAEKAGEGRDWPHKARLAIVALHLGESKVARNMLQVGDRPDPVERTMFIKTFPTWHGKLPELVDTMDRDSGVDNSRDGTFRSGMCCALGGVPEDALAPKERDGLKAMLVAWYRDEPDAGIHAAAGYTLRQWRLELPPVTRVTEPKAGRRWYVNSVGMTMVLIREGEFTMASSSGVGDEKPAHKVRISKPFWLGAHEVTVGQYRKFVEDSKYNAYKEGLTIVPIWEQTDDHPAVNVSWEDAKAFCDWLTKKEKGKAYRLPTEAEGEYACRAGTETLFSFGDNESDLGEYGWFAGNSNSQAHPVGEKKPSAWGLYDMHGNVWERCRDWFDGGYYTRSPMDDPIGPHADAGGSRVTRGGDWDEPAFRSHSAHRAASGIEFRNQDLGFRISRPFNPSGTSLGTQFVVASPEKSNGLTVAPKPEGDGVLAECVEQGRRGWRTLANKHVPSTFMYFDVDDAWIHDGDESLEVLVTYLDGGPKEWFVDYDSADPNLKYPTQAFRLAGTQPIQGTDKWRQVRFALPHARLLGRSNGSDLRLGAPSAGLVVAEVVLRQVPTGP